MELATLRSVITLIAFGLFVSILLWTWSGRNKARFETAAELPFADDESQSPSSAAQGQQRAVGRLK
jgi:cytochrome c oxidase cbb3-type subunit IV